jgi:hypothetical protein
MAGATGLEPATSGVTGRRSDQLSYAPAASTEAGTPTLPPEGCQAHSDIDPVSGHWCRSEQKGPGAPVLEDQVDAAPERFARAGALELVGYALFVSSDHFLT